MTNNNYKDFIETIKKIENASKWENIRTSEIKVLESSNAFFNAEEGEETLFINGKIDNVVYPVHHLALNGLTARAGFGITGNKFFKSPAVPVPDKVNAINAGLQFCNPDKTVKVLTRGGYYLAFHSDKYVPVNQEEIFSKTDEKLKGYKAAFNYGEYSLEKSEARYKIESEGLDEVKAKLQRHGFIKKGDNVSVNLTVVTSDVTISGINCFISCRLKNFQLPLCDSIKVPHMSKEKAPLDKFISKMDNLYQVINAGIDKIAALKNIEIDYPQEVINKLLKKCSVDKKSRESFLNEAALEITGASNAFDVYCCLCNILNYSSDSYSSISMENRISAFANMSVSEWNELDS